MKLFLRVFFSFFILFCVSVYAQVQPMKPGQPNELDNKFSPSNSSIFKPGSNTGSNNKSSSGDDVEFKNAIKCNVALLPRKIAAFGYERFLGEHIGAEGWLGFVFGKDPIFSVLGSQMIFDQGVGGSAIDLSDIMQSSTHYLGGLYYGAAIRFNFDSYYWSGASSFISIGFRSYSQKLDISPLINQQYSSIYKSFEGSKIADLSQINYLLTYGYRLNTEGKIKTSHEFYFSTGIRNVSHSSYSSREGIGDNTIYYPNSNKQNFTGFFFGMGYILGVGF
ncbi:MAG: hypothetical protein ACK5D5_13150 [Bacteroidota bacterium]